MQAFLFYLLLPFLYLFSVLPMRLLYFIGDVLIFPLLYYVLGYRLKVVRKNIVNAYSNISKSESRVLEKKYYHFLVDLMLETLKNFTQGEIRLKKYVSVKNDPKLEQFIAEGQSFLVTTGHLGNYEWIAKSLPFFWNTEVKIPYRIFSNKYFDRLIKKARCRFGTHMFPTSFTKKELENASGKAFGIILANDQSAPAHKSYWTTFLNQDTSFFIGTEMVAREFKLPVFYALINRTSRGKYCFETQLISENPEKEELGMIMETHARLLEKDILANPSTWLWSHKRWKHKKPEGLEKGFSHLKK